MKSTFRTMAIAACFALVSLTSCYLERKCGRNVDGKFCKYAEVHYEVISASGETSEKMLFLLMSEHCDSVLDISEERDKEWTNKETLSSEEIKAIIESALKDKL